MTTTFANAPAISAEFQFCLDLMTAKGVTPCLSTSYEDETVVNVFSRKTRGTRHTGRSPRANVRFCKTTEAISLMGFK